MFRARGLPLKLLPNVSRPLTRDPHCSISPEELAREGTNVVLVLESIAARVSDYGLVSLLFLP